MSLWHSRGYLPHFEGGQIAQFITFRLFGTIPASLLRTWHEMQRQMPPSQASNYLSDKIDSYLDREALNPILADPHLSRIVEGSLIKFDGERYQMHAWVIMPNHVHTIITPTAGNTLSTSLVNHVC